MVEENMTPNFLVFLYFLVEVFLCSQLLLFKLDATADYSRADFPPAPEFVFGASSSAYQTEGAAFEDGRTPSNWDFVAHAGYSFIGNSNADIACDSYHKYKEDVKLMVDTGLEAYRFSISWSRLIPDGSGTVNAKGLEYYNNLINELITNGIQPHVTLLHGDIPQILEENYGGSRSREIVEDFVQYADVCFREFGNRVLYWTTINEPNIFAIGGYDEGITPPCRCSSPFGDRENCTIGNSTTEPYIVGHNLLLAHASAATLYREKYQSKQLGFIGINLYAPWYSPFTNSIEDAKATKRAIAYQFGWYMHPLVFGDYPEIMKKNSGSKLPTFTKQESKQVKGSIDFIGLNHYSTMYVVDVPNNFPLDGRDLMADMAADTIDSRYITKDMAAGSAALHASVDRNSDIAIRHVESFGLQRLLEYLKQVYRNPPIFIHENGHLMHHSSGVDDMPRVKYLQAFIKSMLLAVRNGSNTRGYFVWSFLDSYELFGGYNDSYGLHFIDFDDEKLTRIPKLSAKWYSNFLKTIKKYQSY